MVGGLEDVGIGDDQQHSLGRALDQAAGGFEDGDAGSFRTDQRAGNVEAILREQEVQVVAGNAARDVGIAAADKIAVGFGDGLQLRVDIASSSAGADDLVKFLGSGGADLHAQAVVGEDVERFDVVVSLPGHDRMNAAGVVADHASERAAVVRCRIRREGEVVLLGGVAEMVEDHAGLNAGKLAGGIDFEDLREVLGEVHHHGGVAALAGERRASTAGKNGSTVFAAGGERRDDIVVAARDDDTDGDLAIAGAVGGVEGAAAGVEADFAGDARTQIGFERALIHLSRLRRPGTLSERVGLFRGKDRQRIGGRHRRSSSRKPMRRASVCRAFNRKDR